MRTEVADAAWSWVVGATALALLAWAVADFMGVGGAPAPLVQVPAAGEAAAHSLAGAVELHRLLPDATNDLGEPVRVNGVVIGEASAAGFWVRDLRDNIVFVALARRAAPAPLPASGAAVRVRGVLALLSPADQEAQLARAGLVLPRSAVVVRDVKVVPASDGVEVLAR